MPAPPTGTEQSTDEQSMLALSRGDQSGFDRLFERYRQPVYAFYRRRTSDVARAEELTQETFLALLRAAGRYQPLAPFRTFLFAMAFRILAADRRKSALRAFFFLPLRNQEPAKYAVAEDVLWLQQGLSRLDQTDREILMLREFEQLSYAEIAEVLRQPLNTVRSRLFRARIALRESLRGIATEPADALLEKGDRP